VTFQNYSEELSLRYGVGTIEGHVVNDIIYADNDTETVIGAYCNFMAVFKAESLANFASDGVLGLSPHSLQESAPPDHQASELLLQKLFEQGQIKENVFSLYLTD